MKKILTAKEWCEKTDTSWIWAERNKSDMIIEMERYANYKARAVIESLTDEEIEAQFPFDHIYGNRRRKGGAEWAREELLKRIK